MEIKRTLKRSSIPTIERHSFYENDIFYENISLIEIEKRLEEQKKLESRRALFTTFYFKFDYDENGNCKMTTRPWDCDV